MFSNRAEGRVSWGKLVPPGGKRNLTNALPLELFPCRNGLVTAMNYLL